MFLGMVPQKYKAFAGEVSFESLDAGLYLRLCLGLCAFLKMMSLFEL